MKIKEVVKKTLDFSGIIENIAKWLSTGPVGIIFGLIGLGGISAALYNLSKKMKAARYNSDVNEMNYEAGRASQDLGSNAKNNTEVLDSFLEGVSSAATDVVISAPTQVRAGQKFFVMHEGVPPGIPIKAEDKWVLGYTRVGGQTQVIIMNPGERVLSVEVEGVKYSTRVLVK